MSRYIDADETLEQIRKKLGIKSLDYLLEAERQIVAVIQSAPSIDIEPKRGEWVKRTHDTLIAQVNFAYCSECGQPIMHEHTRPLWSFCPNCGAEMRMKGADDEASD